MNKPENDIETFYPASRTDWRKWLEANHLSKQAVWLVCYKKKTGKPTIAWTEAVDEALCFGWIDSVRKTLDEEKFIQFFSRRKAKGTWSKVNKEKINRLIENGQMKQAGFDSIEKAKQNGSWSILDDVEDLILPEDLKTELNKQINAMEYYLSLSKSVRKAILQWLVLAKRPETRQKRIIEIVTLAAQKQKPKHLQ
ncbi:MAG: YdeI/OmpD-associated family protein [Bacteroidota bacterium]